MLLIFLAGSHDYCFDYTNVTRAYCIRLQRFVNCLSKKLKARPGQNFIATNLEKWQKNRWRHGIKKAAD
ncbi:MAG: hypothetical protein EOP06_27815 [Proteobacteria bacterium]|nr:MAG: hypothetical protein EOP06_27815 [Pseudomonadota bacterium]